MKKILIFIVLFLSCAYANAQRKHVLNLSTYDNKKFHWGFSLGVNTVDYRLHFYDAMGDNPDFTYDSRWASDTPYDVMSSSQLRADLQTVQAGFTVAIIADYRLGDYFNLRFLPGLSFGERQLVYTFRGNSTMPVERMPIYNIYTGQEDQLYIPMHSTYLEFPILLKYKSSRLNNQKPYIIGGMAYRQDVSRTGEEDLINLKGGSFYVEFGVGLDSYLPYFKFSTELKFSLGLQNLIDSPSKDQRRYYSESISSIASNIFTLSFHFE
ncbi:MAG: outer membrane beta-barrel protein [Mangrovibacterium sp.]